jgi:thiol-disulfide isomerase/thioredoxin
MANIVEVVRRYISPYYNIIVGITFLVLFMVIGYYAYDRLYLKRVANKFKDVSNEPRRNKEVTVFFFHVDWCPHCKKALPEWNAFKAQNDGKPINGYLVKCVDMDCTNESSDITRAINEYKIDSYPTVKMLREEKVIDFDSKITTSSLNSFVTTMLNE